ncbi:MAG: sulfatase-like hydrolase/transferase [Planctomycetaceae bacterium]
MSAYFRRLFSILVVLLFAVTPDKLFSAADRPNILWILSEDNSIHYMRLYGDSLGIMPNVERLASRGLTFEHAFSNAPVCSVARTTLMTGMLAPRIGFQYHRKSSLASLPAGAQLFPAYLRKAGYYTTNNSKKDYNVVEGKVWDESSRTATWRKRTSPDQPFFHMQTTGVSHESSLHFSRQQMKQPTTTDVQQVQVPPYFPDTATFRYTQARYNDRMRAVDVQVGNILDRITEDGLEEDTIVFYFGDHGGVLPRSKGYLYETGLHVPLVVYVPEKWQSLVDQKTGTRQRGFVSFIDFGPTVLRLAGLDIPETMDGRAFLGEGVSAQEVNSRETTFGHADRFDEKYDLCRSYRKGPFKYIRNYQAFYPDGLQNNYRYRMLAYAEWRELYAEQKLNSVQQQFFQPKLVEHLYNVEQDPHEIHNLSGDPDHQGILKDLRTALQVQIKNLPDLSFYPESVMVERALDDGAAFGQSHREEIARLIDIADLSLLSFTEAAPGLKEALASGNPWERYWALNACSCFGQAARSFEPAARALLIDSELLVRVRAAEFLAIISDFEPAPTIAEALSKSESPVESLLIFNTVVFLKDRSPTRGFSFDLKAIRSPGGEVERRLEYLGLKSPTRGKGGTRRPGKKQNKPQPGSTK